MKTKFHNAQGLTEYSLRCGYVQRVESGITGHNITVTLWHEGCFHVRYHNHSEGGRIEWVSENNLTDARTQWKALVTQIFGKVIKEIKSCPLYTVSQEYYILSEPSFVVRYMGVKIGTEDNPQAAWLVAAEHNKNRLEEENN